LRVHAGLARRGERLVPSAPRGDRARRRRNGLRSLTLDDRDRDQPREQRDGGEGQQALDDAPAQPGSSAATTASPSSSSCADVIALGAPDIGSRPAWFFGNAITSLRFG